MKPFGFRTLRVLPSGEAKPCRQNPSPRKMWRSHFFDTLVCQAAKTTEASMKRGRLLAPALRAARCGFCKTDRRKSLRGKTKPEEGKSSG
jgi:hypothetical protein